MEMKDLAKEVLRVLNGEGDDYCIHEIVRANDVTKVGIMKNVEGVNAIIYLDDVINADTALPGQLAGHVKGLLESASEHVPEITKEHLSDRKRVFFQALNSERNRKYLEDTSVVKYLDLVFVPRYLVSCNNDGVASVLLSDKMLDGLGLDVQRDFEEIKQNTLKLFGVTVETMSNILRRHGVNSQDAAVASSIGLGKAMCVISNAEYVNGAAAALLSEAYRNLAASGFLLPSSIHEFIALPEDHAFGGSDLSDMVKEVNATCVASSDFLSGSVYYWSEGKELEIVCTD